VGNLDGTGTPTVVGEERREHGGDAGDGAVQVGPLVEGEGDVQQKVGQMVCVPLAPAFKTREWACQQTAITTRLLSHV
jgi:hypothetical protein